MKDKVLQDYLKIIYILSLDRKKVENEDIALILETDQAEVKKNLDELIDKGYIIYNKNNHKFNLTDKGLTVARKIYKKHELFEDFFKKIIKIGHQVAHIYSDILEHISTDATEKQFDHLLKHFDYWARIVPLTFLEKGETGRLVRIEGGHGLTSRLYELGLCGNVEIKVLEGGSYKGPIKIKVRGSELVLGYGQARRILVEHKGKDDAKWKKHKKRWEGHRKKWKKHRERWAKKI